MIQTIEIKDTANLGDLLRTIVNGLEHKPHMPLYSVEIPYAFEIDGKLVHHTYNIMIRATNSEEARRKAILNFTSRVMEGESEGYDRVVRPYLSKIKVN